MSIDRLSVSAPVVDRGAVDGSGAGFNTNGRPQWAQRTFFPTSLAGAVNGF
jgi:hypothetical protein